ncbi:hypothetical protein QLH32_02415 [Acinetobacter corruptisaponis]|uniref:Terminase small subunit n=1 Tax=Acinetobacter corruptisaponis TaxID=3045147 RepID=A0ABY8S669_9GAMM|nr:hypothetical protein [Acinetobacter sp. KCTC 92772]WHP06342.1 hypothetical protein QLH32_02415 [Acinetobacter sp. KCTC 92772]
MNTAVHIMQTVDWRKYDLPDWLRQCGAWQRSCSGGKQAANPIAMAMQKAKVRLKKKDRAKLIAYYLCDTQELQQTVRHKVSCQITDDEARAVQRLVLDIINGTDSEATLETEAFDYWMNQIIKAKVTSKGAITEEQFKTEQEKEIEEEFSQGWGKKQYVRDTKTVTVAVMARGREVKGLF